MKTNDIFVTPVKRYATPKYPTQTDANHTPELLKKLPSKWEKNAAVITAISMIGAITLTSCGVFEPKIRGYNPASRNFLNVAPVFIHGEGTGYMGCVMVAPPVFLSEQEALAIIKDIMESEGLNLSGKIPEYVATSNKKNYEKKYSWERYPENEWLGDGNVGLDFYDGKKGVAVSYISMEKGQTTYEEAASLKNIEELMDWRSRPRELAEMAAEDFAKQKGDIAIGVFYEPGTDWASEEHKKILDEFRAKNSELWEKYYDEETQGIAEKYFDEFDREFEEARAEYETKTRLCIEEELSNQVRDFIKWLQGQGII